MDGVEVDPPSSPPKFHCKDSWGWNNHQKSHEVRISGACNENVLFHPNWSNGTAGVRGECVLNGGPAARFYWEIKIADRIFGTSMMFGIGTKKSRLHADCFVNMIGEDDQGWGLSHKGLLWHNNQWIYFTKPFPENRATTIGLLYDGIQGTLTYYKDDICLGVAFTGLNTVKEKLYPLVSSTAAKTVMTLTNTSRDFISLKDVCRFSIISSIRQKLGKTKTHYKEHIKSLGLPLQLEEFITDQRDVRDFDCEDDGFAEQPSSEIDLFGQKPWHHFSLDFCSSDPSRIESSIRTTNERSIDDASHSSYSMSQL